MEKKRFRVLVYSTVIDTYFVDAKNKDEANELVLSGSLQADKEDSQFDDSYVEEFEGGK
jgi:hypothetical protein